MAERIEDYALLGDLQTSALVGSSGSIDWLCFPRFDSGACFAALLGDESNGRWLLAPTAGGTSARRYLDETLVLETTWTTETGVARVLDFMPPRGVDPDVVRLVEGISGTVDFTSELVIRFDYGRVVPWVRHVDGARIAVAGPDSLVLRTSAETRGENLTTISELTVTAGEHASFVLTWAPSYSDVPEAIDPRRALEDTITYWRDWGSRCGYEGEWHDAVHSSLLALKALTYAPSGGIVAAATTSLPEHIGGVRNWDYRYCWLRDATLTLLALVSANYVDEADAWRRWLIRAVAGEPGDLQIMYSVVGERRLTELELPWLAGYEGSLPVRIGNSASEQLQLDVYGEVMDALYQARSHGMRAGKTSWSLQQKLLEGLEERWREPDEGIWEVRGPRRHFTHSKVMAWVAFDRAVRSVEEQGLDGPVERWRALRAEIHEQVCSEGFDAELNAFTQYYGGRLLDASCLLIPLVGFLPADDARVAGTIAAIKRDLTRDGYVMRYPAVDDSEDVDGLPAGEGVFLPCSFWLVDCLELQGRHDEAHALFERLLSLRNDLGLISEEYDPVAQRLLGNFPQAFTHLALVSSAFNLSKNHPSTSAHRHAH